MVFMLFSNVYNIKIMSSEHQRQKNKVHLSVVPNVTEEKYCMVFGLKLRFIGLFSLNYWFWCFQLKYLRYFFVFNENYFVIKFYPFIHITVWPL